MSEPLLSEKFQTRPATWNDVSDIVALLNASSQSTRGTNFTAVHWQKRHWYESGINLETDSLLILVGKTAVAYAELTSEAPYVVYEMVGAVHPDYRQQGLGSQFVKWAENRVQKTLDKAPEGTAVFIQNSIFDSNQPGRDLLATHGFKIVRDFVYLQIHIDKKPPDPVWVDGIEERPLQSTDWAKVGPALGSAFEDHWGIVDFDEEEEVETDDTNVNPRESDPEAFNSAYFNSPGLCFVAWDGDEVVGSCLCNATTVEFPKAGYLGSLSIRRPWRRRGIGLALTLRALNTFYKRGITHVLTDTDGDSFTKAFRVYQKAGMEIFRRELVYEKTIRLGHDLVKRNMPSA